jgi:hypothetical protein
MKQNYCSSCGRSIPEGQGKSCSMCYGDVAFGRDNYYKDWLEDQASDEYEQQRDQEQEQQENTD